VKIFLSLTTTPQLQWQASLSFKTFTLFLIHPTEEHQKDAGRVAAGLKAAIRNPNVSDEAKDRAAERLQNLGSETATTDSTHDNRVLGMLFLAWCVLSKPHLP
jgi:Conidiation protein 6